MTLQLYFKRQNASRLNTLQKQGTMDVTSFFNKLSIIWQEIELCREIV